MELTIVRAGSELIPDGSIDLVTRQQLIDAGLELLNEHGSLTLNMKAVDFMDSVGIGAVIELAKKAAAVGGSFAVVEPSPPVQRVLAVTGLTNAWPPAEPATGNA
jgi:anti-anti-sigma factor